MNKRWRTYAVPLTLALVIAGPMAALGARAQEQVAQGMMGQGMMGQGGMRQGGMGPGMMQIPQPQPGAGGAAIFGSQCAQCHTLVAGPSSMPGPSLQGLFGRKAGTVPGYNYSPAMRNSGVVWSEATLDRFIAAPQRFVPGNIMPFPGIADEGARQRLVAYLKAATK